MDMALLGRVRGSATCSRSRLTSSSMGMQHACMLLEHIGGRKRKSSRGKRELVANAVAVKFRAKKVDGEREIFEYTLRIVLSYSA